MGTVHRPADLPEWVLYTDRRTYLSGYCTLYTDRRTYLSGYCTLYTDRRTYLSGYSTQTGGPT